jgi:superfamily I DNA and/or RNA helicase
MNKKLMSFPNGEFYDNLLETYSGISDITLNDLADIDEERVLEFIDTHDMSDNRESHINDSKSYINRTEARICIELANDYISKGIRKDDIGIISPYADQVKLISEHVDVEVKSVDGFQGREKEIIIISTVRSNDNREIGFLNDLRRLNVAITRAKRKLIVVGNSATLNTNPTYKKFIKTATYN